MKANGKRKSTETSSSRKCGKETEVAADGMEKYDKYYLNFERPPFAPIYTPTLEEFADPIEYVTKIRAEAEKYGVVKIVPPEGFKPPFVLDMDEFTFSPRIQKLNEIEAIIKEKSTFTQRLVNYNRLNGVLYDIPIDKDGKPIDLHRLHRIIQALGGLFIVNAEDLWKKVAVEMLCGKAPTGSFIKILKTQYENHVEPFIRCLKERRRFEDEESDLDDEEDEKHHYQHHHGEWKKEEEEDEEECTPTMQGRRRAGNGKKKPSGRMMAGLATREPPKKRKAKPSKFDSSSDPMDSVFCSKCKKGDDEDYLLVCEMEDCGIGMHTYCCDPPLEDVPKGEWRCTACIQAEDAKIGANWGFYDADVTYSLRSFTEFANAFKCDYFGVKDPMSVPDELVEAEFWKNVYSADSVSVKYGADLITSKVGSGFPRKTDEHRGTDARLRNLYANHPWNLNNMPVLKDSILSHIDTDISGMIVPWIYVGMCFSTFCWHTEDHWTYSINYNHWGERKIWYGIGGEDAEVFEDAVRKLAPGLTGRQIDLFHHMTTAANPALLRSMGVPIHTVHQNAGEFVITFPRAYHAGFNEGLNLAEAVNFAPIDWLSKGRHCIMEYSNVKRFCVFSHEEVVLKMVAACDKLGISMSVAALDELMEISKREHQLRGMIAGVGIEETKREVFEDWPDDGRACRYCKTTVFLSGIGCPHGHIVCLEHFDRVCKTCDLNKCTLLYRYTMDELLPMVKQLEERTTDYYIWTGEVDQVLHNVEKPPLADVEKLIEAAKQRKFPSTAHLFTLQQMRNTCKAAIEKAHMLASGKIRVRNKTRCQRADTRLDFEGILTFIEEIRHSPCDLDYLIGDLENLVERIRKWQEQAKAVMEAVKNNTSTITTDEVNSLLDEGEEFDVKMIELDHLKRVSDIKRWEVRAAKLLSWEPTDGMEDKDEFEERGRWTIDHVVKLSSEGASLFPGTSTADCPATRLHTMMRTAKMHDTEAKEFLENPSLEKLAEMWEKMRLSDWCSAEHLNALRMEVIAVNRLQKQFMERSPMMTPSTSSCAIPSTSSLTTNSISYVELDEMNDLFEESKILKMAPVYEEVTQLRIKTTIFTEKLQMLFRPNVSYYNLFETIGEHDELATLVQGLEQTSHLQPSDPDPLDEWRQLEEFKSSETLKEKQETLRGQKKHLLKALREANTERTANETCICAGGDVKGKRIQGELACLVCNAKYHVACCDWNPVLDTFPEGTFLCVRCLRGRRPVIEDVQALFPLAPQNSLELCLVKELIARAREASKQLLSLAAEFDTDQQVKEKLELALIEWLSCEVINTNSLPKVQKLLPIIFKEKLNRQRVEVSTLRGRPDRKNPFPTLFTRGNGLTKDRRGKRHSMISLGKEPTKKYSRKSRVEKKVEEDAEATCSADMCLKPFGDLMWIQCEAGCSRWYHYVCVGQTVKGARNVSLYECYRCKASTDGGSSSSSSSTSSDH